MAKTTSPVPEGKPAHLNVQMHWTWSPLGLLIFLPMPVLFYALSLPESAFSAWGQFGFFTGTYKLIALVCFGFLLLTAVALSPLVIGSGHVIIGKEGVRRINLATRVVAVLTFGAYLVWLAVGISRGLNLGLLAEFFSGEPTTAYVLKQRVLAPLPGITTWTQLGTILGPLAIIRWRVSGSSAKHILVWLVFAAATRALINSERLALIEVGVALAVALLATRSKAPRAFSTLPKAFITWILSMAGLVVFFAVFEMSRSWVYYAPRYRGTVLDFAIQRLAGYYATALNNGALYVNVAGSGPTPGDMFAGGWAIPGLPSLVTILGGSNSSEFFGALVSQSSPEFNNVSGLLLAVAAWGVPGACIFWTATGVLVSLVAYTARRGSLTALVLYCALGVGILEVVRLFYYGDSRMLPLYLATAILAIYFRPSAVGILSALGPSEPSYRRSVSSRGSLHSPRVADRMGVNDPSIDHPCEEEGFASGRAEHCR